MKPAKQGMRRQRITSTLYNWSRCVSVLPLHPTNSNKMEAAMAVRVDFSIPFRIQLGAVRLVVLNDINSVKKYYAHKALQHRPPTILLKVPNLEGMSPYN